MLRNVSKNLAFNLKIERTKKNLSQEKLAEQADISMKHITMIENCKVTPSINIVCSLAAALNISVDKLIADIED